VSRQTPEQLVVPDPHDTAHVPDEHTWPAGHAVPHIPQLRLSVWMSRHAPEQSVKPVAHDTAHTPPEHT
jgi:hypothetical protein